MRIFRVILPAVLIATSVVCLAPKAGAAGLSDIFKGRRISAAEEPTDFKGLVERARLEKSKGDYREAVRFYSLALKVAPINQKEGVSTELATVMAWGGDYEGAIKVYSGVLATDPLNRQARLGLARTYAWAKDYANARAEFNKVLAADPGNTEARIGLARVYSWEGSYKAAGDIYRDVLAKDDSNAEARLALSNTLWWSGDLDGALAEARTLVKAEPDNLEAARLERKLREEKGPKFGLMWASSSDSDSNKLTTYRASNYFNISPLLRINLDYSRYRASRLSKKAHADVFTVRDTLRPTKELTIHPSLSYVSTGSDAGGHDYVTGGLSAYWDLYKDTTAIFSYSLAPLVDTPTLIENNIRMGAWSAALIHHWSDVTMSGALSYHDYSDNNSSTGIRGNIAWKAYDKGPEVVAGYIPEYRAFSKKTYSGYYNPADIFSNTLYLTVSGVLYRDAVEYEFTGTTGVQSADNGGEFTSSFKALVKGRLTDKLSAYAGYKWSRSALESATGFRYEEFRAGLDYLF